MSNIEEALRRLEQLRKAGVEAPNAGMDPEGRAPADDRQAKRPPTPERLAEVLTRNSVTPAYAGGAVSAGPPVAATRADAGGEHADADVSRQPPVEIDLGAMALAGFITPEGPRAQIAEEFRVIKRPIIRSAHWKSSTRVERGNRVMVTSALPGEGKTFVAINLALSIALEVDTTVLLVDADVANPCVGRVMNVRADRGLMDLLTSDRLDIADVMLKTNVDKLSLMLAGTPQGRATEMLASQAMANLVADMASRYPDRILVFDSPPLLVTTEARVLASHMGQIVMVVEAAHTTRTAVTRALETIEACPTVLMVLNKAPRSEVGGYYEYRKYGETP